MDAIIAQLVVNMVEAMFDFLPPLPLSLCGSGALFGGSLGCGS